MTHICTLCDEVVEDEEHWDEISKLCKPCFQVGGSSDYCCGVIYDDGETSCRSCGEPL